MLLTSLVNIGSNGVLRQTLGRSYKHCGAAGKLWGNFGSNWVLDTGYWQETIKGITKVNIVVELQTLTSGETLGSTTNVGEQLQILANIVEQRGKFGE